MPAGRAVVGGGDQAGDASPLDELAAHQVARPLGGDQGAVDSLGRDDLAEVDVEPVRAEQEVARPKVRLDLAGVDVALDLVGQEDIDQVAGLGGLGGRHRLEAVADGQVVIGRARALADHHVAARVAQVLRLGVPLAAIADHRDRLALEQREVGILVVVHLGGHRRSLSSRVGRVRATSRSASLTEIVSS